MVERKTSSTKKWGVGLTITPIVIWILVAMANGFDFSHSWLGSSGTDWFFGVIGIVIVVIGMALWSPTDKQ